MQNSDNFLSVSDTAAQLKVSRQRILELINEGRINAFKIGKTYVVYADSINSLHLNPVGRPRKDAKAA